ncbi:SAM-dependent methyltransferase, MidA family [Micromonospora nigra]|uniref:SAM-dependent methyltransferase, MidA family n=1 Tax=Micromonospora nigra TaxID=145857 RepID=A0A1C6RUX7_9ACTN|nr:SAM-dependent methyltransferase [Micromonospora nigra]SCL20965.1 SAM-dependent methyltransferase, MidA family [Micromonospora nigra]
MSMRWRDAMDRALYGPGGFFVSGAGPAAHFRTSVHASPAFASAVLRLLAEVDATLGHPPVLDVVDVGAGRGELLRALAGQMSAAPTHAGRSGLLPAGPGGPDPTTDRPSRSPGSHPAGPPNQVSLADRVRLTAVERAARPADLPAAIGWLDEIPSGVSGLLIATEWLDNVPLDVAVPTGEGWRYVLVDPTTGTETVGPPLTPQDADWLHRWWPEAENGVRVRAEIGRERDEAWADAVGRVDRGLAVAVDYGHLRAGRPVDGTLTGYRGGRQVPPVPDGSRDVTAHVAVDSVASCGERVARCAYSLVSQREALRALGADGARPPLSLAATDPTGYVRALAAASTVAELTDPAGLGGHWWLLQPVGSAPDP